MDRRDGLWRNANQKDRHTLVEVDAVIQSDGRLNGFPPKIGQCADDALNGICVYADRFAIVINAENQVTALRQVCHCHQVFSQAVFVGGERGLPIQLI